MRKEVATMATLRMIFYSYGRSRRVMPGAELDIGLSPIPCRLFKLSGPFGAIVASLTARLRKLHEQIKSHYRSRRTYVKHAKVSGDCPTWMHFTPAPPDTPAMTDRPIAAS